jgi:hypothetical protein
MERFIRNEDDSLTMRMRLIYNGELTSTAGVPLSQIAIATGLPDNNGRASPLLRAG